MKQFTAARSGPLSGKTSVPGDKSISHRALMFGALSIGETRITGLLEATDVLATARIVAQLGANVSRSDEGEWIVAGRGVGGLCKPDEPLDFGNSGTSARLMAGIITGHDIEAVFQGDESLSRRPMGRVLTPLKQMGLSIPDSHRDTLPLTLRGAAQPIPISYKLPVPSAQVKSAVLLAGLSSPGDTTVIEPEITRDHTEKMLQYFGARLDIVDGENGRSITLKGHPILQGKPINVPGDPSSSAFLTAAALICPGSDITIENVLVNPTRTGFYQTLEEMGANVTFENHHEQGGEPVCDIRVQYSKLKGVTVPPERAPSMIDEYPILAALAAYAEGQTVMQGLAELRVKESDRLAATETALAACGVDAHSEDDTLIVRGLAENVPGGGVIATEMDHRIAMSFLVLGLQAQEPVIVDDISMIETSFPSFFTLMESLGARFKATS
ncbi:MAG: 3-phosphoshikimate 1-carboxyvinyltransferase [Hyphomicrobiales bacterium]|nr:3-phosphoshikimate 1-carboxyvinyltransferase [Hyphomicrobiales bacterium]